MFHRMSSGDVYTRFFRDVSALTYEEAQRLCNVDSQAENGTYHVTLAFRVG